MRKVYIILFVIFFVTVNYGQDKIIFKDGTKHNCKIVSINKSTVTFKDSENATALTTKSKAEIVLAEYASGSVYIFGNEKQEETIPGKKPEAKTKNSNPKKDTEQNNMLGTQLFSSFLGRTGLTYERFFYNKQMSVAIPLFVTYSPYADSFSSSNSPVTYSKSNINFVTGADLNYFFDTKQQNVKFFVGPRLRYGTDVLVYNVTGLSVQAQNGLLIHSLHNPKIAHTLAFGFGFVRVITTPKSNPFDPKQSFPWMSLTYRFNFKW